MPGFCWWALYWHWCWTLWSLPRVHQSVKELLVVKKSYGICFCSHADLLFHKPSASASNCFWMGLFAFHAASHLIFELWFYSQLFTVTLTALYVHTREHVGVLMGKCGHCEAQTALMLPVHQLCIFSPIRTTTYLWALQLSVSTSTGLWALTRMCNAFLYPK